MSVHDNEDCDKELVKKAEDMNIDSDIESISSSILHDIPEAVTHTSSVPIFQSSR